MELISKENVLNFLQRGIDFWYDEDEKAHEALKTMKFGIEAMPTIESRPKGKWIKRHSYDRRDNFYACSECGRIINIICGAHLEDYPFCHCGSDMRGEE